MLFRKRYGISVKCFFSVKILLFRKKKSCHRFCENPATMAPNRGLKLKMENIKLKYEKLANEKPTEPASPAQPAGPAQPSQPAPPSPASRPSPAQPAGPAQPSHPAQLKWKAGNGKVTDKWKTENEKLKPTCEKWKLTMKMKNWQMETDKWKWKLTN